MLGAIDCATILRRPLMEQLMMFRRVHWGIALLALLGCYIVMVATWLATGGHRSSHPSKTEPQIRAPVTLPAIGARRPFRRKSRTKANLCGHVARVFTAREPGLRLELV